MLSATQLCLMKAYFIKEIDPQRRFDHAIRALHQGPAKVLFTVDGLGFSLPFMIGRSGASNTLLAFRMPYKQALADDLIGMSASDKFADTNGRGAYTSVGFALSLATTELMRGLRIILENDHRGTPCGVDLKDLYSVALVGAVQTDRERRSPDGWHIAIARFSPNSGLIEKFTLSFDAEKKDFGVLKGEELTDAYEAHRTQQDLLASYLTIDALLYVIGGKEMQVGVSPHAARELNCSDTVDANSAGVCKYVPTRLVPNISALDETCNAVMIKPNGETMPLRECGFSNSEDYYIPVTAHPVAAHYFLALRARKAGKNPVFVLSATHVTKPDVSLSIMAERAAQFIGVFPVVVTRNAPRFYEMVQLLRQKRTDGNHPSQITIAMGTDAAKLFFDGRFYGVGGIPPLSKVLKDFQNWHVTININTRPEDGKSESELFNEVCMLARQLSAEELLTSSPALPAPLCDLSSTAVRKRLGIS